MDILLGTQKVELWYFGRGHSTGDIVVFFPEEKAAFVGYQVFLGMTPGVYSEIGGDTFEHVKTLNKMMDTLDAQQFINGHHDSILSRTDIWTYIDGVRKKQERVWELLNQGHSLEEVTLVGETQGAASVEINGNRLFLGFFDGLIKIFDITDPKSPNLLTKIKCPDEVLGLVAADNYLFINYKGMLIKGISDLSKIVDIGHYSRTEGSHGMVYRDGYVYYEKTGLTIFKIIK